MPPEAVLRTAIKRTLKFLTDHPNVSRTSILHDWGTGWSTDHMQNAINVFDAILQQILSDEKSRFLAGHIFRAACQAFFMRSDVLFETRGMDIFDAKVQEAFVDDLVCAVLNGLRKEEPSDAKKEISD